MSARSRVSVLMPAFNAERFLAEAIESVLAQTHEDLELLIVDDGSKDGTLELARGYARRDPRVRVLQNPENLGTVRTRNRLFDEADPKSELFALMDADDVCLPDRFAEQLDFLRVQPGHALVGGNLILIDEAGDEIGRREYPQRFEDIARVITRVNPIAQPAAMLRRTAIEAVGRYDARYPQCQDYDLWMRVARRFEIANLARYVLRYRISQGQVKSRALKASLRYTLQIQREYMLEPRFFRPANIAYWLAQHGLLALPDAVVLELWKRVTLKR
jgi:glycosyltransferase involved in cell wall biosynthesis